MNGRVYDYNVGRFLSVDPFLQFPENSQSANPYSYILNNPMSGVDPTGYSAEVDEELKDGATLVQAKREEQESGVGNGQENEKITVRIKDNRSANKVGTRVSTTVGAVLNGLATGTLGISGTSGASGQKKHQIDFDFISELEGGSRTDGYVPDATGSKSGVTVGVGFDLGARNESDLKSLGLPQELIDKLNPYLGMQGTAAAEYIRTNPLTISKADASTINLSSHPT